MQPQNITASLERPLTLPRQSGHQILRQVSARITWVSSENITDCHLFHVGTSPLRFTPA